jgi:hypothetical protein
MYSRFVLQRTISSAASSPKPSKFPYGCLLATCLLAVGGAKIVKNKFEEKKRVRYGCYARPKKYISYHSSSKIKN